MKASLFAQKTSELLSREEFNGVMIRKIEVSEDDILVVKVSFSDFLLLSYRFAREITGEPKDYYVHFSFYMFLDDFGNFEVRSKVPI